ncbi:YggT family protein [Acinetobacter sp. A3.8]|uniref:YggT family protein n=1 Tax=Acinetobacter sedimenti TaxID=2919922 RepID=A0A9X1WZL1_9GAMM|nr:YggT family protein [Acinetobacter sedimenti]MCJ8146997.1 YggT family protein [Acinetobacter sedimenti]
MALLLNVLLNVVILLVFLRFLMQLAGINFFNPVVQSTIKATKFVDVLNRSLPKPAKGRINLAALILLIILYLVKVSVLSNMGLGITIFEVHYKNLASGADSLLLGTLMAVTDGVVTFCRYLIFAAIIMSWVTLFTQKSGPFTEAIQELAEPLFAPFRKIMPNMGMIDLSPLLAILALIIIDVVMTSVSFAVIGGFH